MEGADLQQEAGDQAEIIQRFQKPYHEFQHNAGDHTEKSRRVVHAGIQRRVLSLLHLYVELAIHILCRVVGIQVRFDDRIGRGECQFLFHRHAKDDVLAAGIHLLPRHEAVQRRIFGDRPHIGGNDHMADTKALQPLLPLTAHIFLQFRDLHRFGEKIIRAGSVDHDVGGNAVNGRSGANEPPIGAVAPCGVIVPIVMDFDSKGQNYQRQNQQIGRQNRPKSLHTILDNACRCQAQQHKHQQPIPMEPPADNDRIDYAEQQGAKASRHTEKRLPLRHNDHLPRGTDAHEPNGEGCFIEHFLSCKEDDQGKQHRSHHRPHDLPPYTDTVDPRKYADTHNRRGQQERRRQPCRRMFSLNIYVVSFLHFSLPFYWVLF